MFHLGPASEEKPAIDNKHIFCHCEFTNQLEDSKKIVYISYYLLLTFTILPVTVDFDGDFNADGKS